MEADRQASRLPILDDGVTLSRLGTAGLYVTKHYSAKSPFVFYKTRVEVPFNLTRGSAIRKGAPCDGSSVGASPVIMPWLDETVFDARAYLRFKCETDPELKVRATRLCQKHDVLLDRLISEGPDKVIWMDRTPYDNYGDRHTFPILKAIFAHQSFVILEDGKGCGFVNGRFDEDFHERMLELEAISETVVAVPGGLLVPAPLRLLGTILLLLLALAAAAASILLDNRDNFIEEFESAMFVLALVLLTFPAVVSLLSAEPNLVRSAIHGKMTLTRQSQVTARFGLSRRDYAMLATRTRGSILVSADVGCYLTGEERGEHAGDVPVVTCEDLAPFGVICGQSVHYRTNWQTICISNRLGPNRTHLTNLKPMLRFWCAGVRPDTWVGFSRDFERRRGLPMCEGGCDTPCICSDRSDSR